MQQYFLFNGSFQPEDAPVIGPANRGLRYGDGLFETLKFINGELQLADAHFARLLRGMQVLGFRIPAHWSSEKVGEQCRALALKNGHAAGARVRINVIRGDGGLYDPVSHLPLILIQTWPLPSGAGTWNTNGLVLGICEGVRKSADVLANLKHNNYLGYVLAARQATDQKWNDALVMNTDGGICDTTIANLFAVRGQQIFTPPLSEGGVAGIMRARLLDFLRSRNLPVSEERLRPEDLEQADELFVTNSIHPIRWVQALGRRNYSCATSFRLFQDFLPTI